MTRSPEKLTSKELKVCDNKIVRFYIGNSCDKLLYC